MGGRGVGAPHATLPLMPAPLIWHITEQSCWDEAMARGTYTHSTRDRDLSDEGYIHASWPEQISPVARRVYPDRPDHLVILEIDVAALERAGVTVAIEHGGGGGDDVAQSYPRILGAVPLEAVVRRRRTRWIGKEFVVIA